MSDLKYFEDFAVGDRLVSEPSAALTADEIVDFARRYDPQPFHLDEAEARASLFGGLAASGWQTASLVMERFVEMRAVGGHPIIGLGVDELRWPRPVRPGDRLTVTVEVLALGDARSLPQSGTMRMKVSATNDRGEVVCSMIPLCLVPRRPRNA